MTILKGLVGDKSDAVFAAVDSALLRRHRASSAIEGFNAALRPFLYVHKGVSPGFLELFRVHYNLKTRRWGRHKSTSAHECLTGEPVQAGPRRPTLPSGGLRAHQTACNEKTSA